MIKVDSRESAHVKSRVQDLSVVPNLVSFTGLFAAITPIAKVNKNDDKTYSPILIRDTDSLIANFGDPRIDPEKYIDLYSIMQIVGNGTSCYVAKVDSGNTGIYHFNFLPLPVSLSDLVFNNDSTHLNVWTANSQMPLYLTSVKVSGIDTSSLEGSFGIPIVDATEEFVTTHSADDGTALILNREDLNSIVCELEDNPSDKDKPYKITVTFKTDVVATASVTANSAESAAGLVGYSSMSDQLNFVCKLTQAKPLSIKAFYLTVDIINNGSTLVSAKVKLEPTTTNQGIVNSLNSSLGTYVRFELAEADKEYAAAAEVNNMRDHSIATALLDVYAPHSGTVGSTAEPNRNSPRNNLSSPGYEVELARNVDSSDPDVPPSFEVTLDSYIKALDQYRDKRYVGCLMADLTAPVNKSEDETDFATAVHSLSHEERRSLHFNLKQIACERKDTTVVLSVPYTKDHTDITPMQLDEVCDWVASRGDYENLWSYGETNTTDYAQQSFYLEIYYSWLKLKCTKVANGLATSVDVNVAPANVVVNNILTSWRERGVQYPVAGDQYGTLTDQCSVLQNPKTKLERDQLVQYRINPIWDTGTRGVQIYGNETLNAGYTDLNAAHIARALVYIRSHIDEYTERLKFSINSIVLWDTWKNHVTQFLESMKTSNCLSEYRVLMGTETTSAAEIANRKVNGLIQLIFYQSAELFDLTYTIYSSSTTIDEATANQ